MKINGVEVHKGDEVEVVVEATVDFDGDLVVKDIDGDEQCLDKDYVTSIKVLPRMPKVGDWFRWVKNDYGMNLDHEELGDVYKVKRLNSRNGVACCEQGDYSFYRDRFTNGDCVIITEREAKLHLAHQDLDAAQERVEQAQAKVRELSPKRLEDLVEGDLVVLHLGPDGLFPRLHPGAYSNGDLLTVKENTGKILVVYSKHGKVWHNWTYSGDLFGSEGTPEFITPA